MFGLFRNRKKQRAPRRYAAIEKIRRLVESRQRRLADYLARKADRCPRTWLYLWYFLFCAGFATACLHSLWKGFQSGEDKAVVTPIKIPGHVQQPGQQVHPGFSHEQYRLIRAFSEYMDSLGRSASGKKLYDSLVIRRPGLMDSVERYKNIYEQQNYQGNE